MFYFFEKDHDYVRCEIVEKDGRWKIFSSSLSLAVTSALSNLRHRRTRTFGGRKCSHVSLVMDGSDRTGAISPRPLPRWLRGPRRPHARWIVHDRIEGPCGWSATHPSRHWSHAYRLSCVAVLKMPTKYDT
jgi:hypothetical protein